MATEDYLKEKFVPDGHPHNVKSVDRTLAYHDLQLCLRLTPAPVLALLKTMPAELFVGGGFIRACVAGEPRADIDLFAGDKAKAENFAFLLADARGGDYHASDNAFTVKGLGVPVQIIHRWCFDSPQAMLDSFDFTIAKAAFWYEGGEWKSLVHERFYADLAGKRLIYTSPVRNEDAGGSLLRVLKFYQRGYRIPLDSLAAVVARLVFGLGLTVGCEGETATADMISDLLREVDPAVGTDHIAYLPPERDVSCKENGDVFLTGSRAGV